MFGEVAEAAVVAGWRLKGSTNRATGVRSNAEVTLHHAARPSSSRSVEPQRPHGDRPENRGATDPKQPLETWSVDVFSSG